MSEQLRGLYSQLSRYSSHHLSDALHLRIFTSQVFCSEEGKPSVAELGVVKDSWPPVVKAK